MSSSAADVFVPEYKYADELINTAKALVADGKGLLAADESTGTIGKRFDDIKVENTPENRRAYRHLLFTSAGLEKFISGAILYEETLFDTSPDGKTSLVEPLKKAGVILGIKVDLGTKALVGTDNELFTQGLTDLDKRCTKYYQAGARFAKWRAVLRIGKGCPSITSIIENAQTLAQYAAICQSCGLVPIVEPEILMDGDHSLKTCQFWTEKVVAACYKALIDHNVLLEGTLLKPNMVVAGSENKSQPTTAQIAWATVTALRRSVPPAVPGVVFLSGGQSEEEASANLNAINLVKATLPSPWKLSFSFGRALQASCLDAWKGKAENVAAAQKAFLTRAEANWKAAQGLYESSGSTGAASQSLFVKGYTY